jgi:hypothetical protein
MRRTPTAEHYPTPCEPDVLAWPRGGAYLRRPASGSAGRLSAVSGPFCRVADTQSAGWTAPAGRWLQMVLLIFRNAYDCPHRPAPGKEALR